MLENEKGYGGGVKSFQNTISTKKENVNKLQVNGVRM